MFKKTSCSPLTGVFNDYQTNENLLVDLGFMANSFLHCLVDIGVWFRPMATDKGILAHSRGDDNW